MQNHKRFVHAAVYRSVNLCGLLFAKLQVSNLQFLEFRERDVQVATRTIFQMKCQVPYSRMVNCYFGENDPKSNLIIKELKSRIPFMILRLLILTNVRRILLSLTVIY